MFLHLPIKIVFPRPAEWVLLALAMLCFPACASDPKPARTTQVEPEITITLQPAETNDAVIYTIENNSDTPLVLKAPIIIQPVNVVFTGPYATQMVALKFLPIKGTNAPINIQISQLVIDSLKANQIYILTYQKDGTLDPSAGQSMQAPPIPIPVGTNQQYQAQVWAEDIAPSLEDGPIYATMVIRLEKNNLSAQNRFIQSNWIKIAPQ